MTERTLSFGTTTYNLQSNLEIEITVPKLIFGQKKKHCSLDIHIKDDLDDKVDDESVEMAQNHWHINQVQTMPNTANMMFLAHKNHEEFYFVSKPAPGKRRINIVSYQMVHELQ